MKKALLASLCFVVVSLMVVNGTFAMPDLNAVFADLTDLLGGLGLPEAGGEVVDVDIVSDNTTQNLYPGGAVSRWSRVQNKGSGDVYFRLVYAVQYDKDTWANLDIDFSAERDFIEESSPADGFDENGWKDIKIGDTPYKMKVFTYNQTLPAGMCSPGVRISIAMDASVTDEEMDRYRADFVQIQALAIDPAPFAKTDFNTPQTALGKALPLYGLNPF